MVKVLVAHMQHECSAAIGADQGGRALSCSYEAMIFSLVKLWMKVIHCQDLDQHCGHRVLPGVIILVCLGERQRARWGNGSVRKKNCSPLTLLFTRLTMTWRWSTGVVSLSFTARVSFTSPVSLSIRKRPSSSPSMNTNAVTDVNMAE